jgi:hypothetical protein
VEEKYRIGELFAGLVGEKAPFDHLLQREAQAYTRLETEAQNQPISGERSVSRAFCAEIIRLLQRGL